MRKTLIAALCAAAALSQSPAFAAEIAAQLTDVKGTVLVGNAQGFRAVSGTAELRTGDRVVVASDASGTLVYGPGCGVALPPNSDVTIAPQSCAVSTQDGGVTLYDRFRPLSWGILMGIGALVGALISGV